MNDKSPVAQGMAACRQYRAGDVALESGATLADARLAYVTHGELNASGDNAVLVTTFFGGTHENVGYLLGEATAIDPRHYFIVVVNLFGNGKSTSPSHGLGADFPVVSMADNVHQQYRLLREELGVQRLRLATGHSMGAVSTYHLAAAYPDFVQAAAPICGAARISAHNDVFLRGMCGILTADPAFADGRYETQPRRGLVAMARAWAAWPPSAAFYRHAHFESLGYQSVDDYLERYWEATYASMDANNVLAQIATWRSADIGRLPAYGGDFARALAAIRARCIVMPSRTDAYFPPEDSVLEVAGLGAGELRVIESEWGHWAGSGRNPADTAFIDDNLHELLEGT